MIQESKQYNRRVLLYNNYLEMFIVAVVYPNSDELIESTRLPRGNDIRQAACNDPTVWRLIHTTTHSRGAAVRCFQGSFLWSARGHHSELYNIHVRHLLSFNTLAGLCWMRRILKLSLLGFVIQF
jgi:hypothetical protein